MVKRGKQASSRLPEAAEMIIDSIADIAAEAVRWIVAELRSERFLQAFFGGTVRGTDKNQVASDRASAVRFPGGEGRYGVGRRKTVSVNMRASNDARSNTLNPNNTAYLAAANNRSNQLNRNNTAYHSSRSGGRGR